MAKIRKVKAKLKNGVIKATIAIGHPMTTYNQAEKKTGNKDDANFITHITGSVNGTVVADISTSQFLSKNPIIKFAFKGEQFKKGDKLLIEAEDRKGNKYSKEGKIK